MEEGLRQDSQEKSKLRKRLLLRLMSFLKVYWQYFNSEERPSNQDLKA